MRADCVDGGMSETGTGVTLTANQLRNTLHVPNNILFVLLIIYCLYLKQMKKIHYAKVLTPYSLTFST